MSWEQQVTEKLGLDGIRSLTAAFYRRIAADDLLGPMYPPESLAAAEKRLADFFCFRIAGDPAYGETRGHPRLRMRHAPYQIGEAERDRWLMLMSGAMDEVGLDGTEREALDVFFAQVADFMRNQPDGA